MNRFHIITKSLWQMLLVAVEVFSVTCLLVYLSEFLRPSQDGFDTLERYILFVAAYEIFVFVTLRALNDARRDALLAIKTAYEMGMYYCETGSESVKNDLINTINKQLDNGVFNHLDIRQRYKDLLSYIESRNTSTIKYVLIMIEHNYEACELQWKFTFLLRLFK